MLLAVIPAFAQPSEPHNASAVWLEPSSMTGPGPLVIYCWANISQTGYVWQVTVKFDSSIFQYVSCVHTVGDPSGWDYLDQRDPGADMTLQPLTLTGPVLSGAPTDTVLMGGTCMGDDYVPADTVGSFIKLQLNVIGAPPKGGVIDTEIDIESTYPDDTYMEDEVGGNVPFTPYNANYHQAWVEPAKPHLAVEGGNIDPQHWEYGPYPPSAIGTLFDVDIMIKSLQAAWWLHNATLYLAYNTTLINMTNIVFNTLWGTTDYSYTEGVGVLDELWIEVKDPTSNPSGDVLIATVTFNVTFQCDRGFGEYDDSPLDIHDYELWDTEIEIPTLTEADGTVRIYCLVALPIPYLEVSSVTMGPEPVLGEEFNVTVSIKELHQAWYTVGLEFRLSYPTDLIEPVACHEGPFLPEFAARQPGSMGTFFLCLFEPATYMYPAHVLVGSMIYPNATGWWPMTEDEDLVEYYYPNGEGIIAILTFRVIYQSYGEENMTGPLNIIDQLSIDLDGPMTQNTVDSPLDTPVNGVYEITTNLPGRMIDLYGGALNEGYGSHPFPAPYGGQGLNKPMDMVVPQSEVCLFAEVLYNYWPVQNKIVSYEVEYPDGRILLKQTALTDKDGIAKLCFEMPWPCEDPESLFGVWTVTATVSISDVMVMDTLTFHYDYLIGWWKVTTDKFEYNHCEEVEITIEYGTYAMQWYPALIAVVLYDELIVPVGMVLLETEVGGAAYCTYENFTTTVTIHVPKHAFAGIATIHINAFNKDPTEGGVAWCPEYTPLPEIAIQPYASPLTLSLEPMVATVNITAHENITFTAIASGGLPFDAGYKYCMYSKDPYGGMHGPYYETIDETLEFDALYTGWCGYLGVWEITIIAEDFYGNTVEVTALITVVD